MVLGMEEKTARKNNKRNSKEQVREMGKRNGKDQKETGLLKKETAVKRDVSMQTLQQ